MLALLACCALPTLKLEAGYYTLGELGTACKRQGLEVAVRPECAEEVYALRFTGTSPAALAEALRATGRLEVESTAEGLSIRRAQGLMGTERAKVDHYLKAAFAETVQMRAEAARHAAEMLQLPLGRYDEGRTAYANRLLKAAQAAESTRQEKIATWLYSISSSGMVYADLMVPTLLLADGWKAPGRLYVRRFEDLPGVFYPEGLRAHTRPFEKNPIGLPDDIDMAGMKLRIDPLTTQGVVRIVYGRSKESALTHLTENDVYLDEARLTPPAPEQALRPADVSLYRRRIAATGPALLGEKARIETKLPASIRVSNALLATADGAGQDLVAYVSPLSDRVLVSREKASLRSVIEAANRGEFDAKFAQLSANERTGHAYDPPRSEFIWPSLSAVAAGDTLVVRTETDFLDAMAEGPVTLATPLENRARRGEAPTFWEVTEEVARLPLAEWRGSIFSTRFLSYVNPLSFYPFARGLQASPELRRKLEALPAEGKVEVRWRDLEPAAREAIRQGLAHASPRCDAPAPNGIDAVLIKPLADGLIDTQDTHLSMSRSKGGYRFGIRHIQLYWASWVRNVR